MWIHTIPGKLEIGFNILVPTFSPESDNSSTNGMRSLRSESESRGKIFITATTKLFYSGIHGYLSAGNVLVRSLYVNRSGKKIWQQFSVLL